MCSPDPAEKGNSECLKHVKHLRIHVAMCDLGLAVLQSLVQALRDYLVSVVHIASQGLSAERHLSVDDIC